MPKMTKKITEINRHTFEPAPTSNCPKIIIKMMEKSPKTLSVGARRRMPILQLHS